MKVSLPNTEMHLTPAKTVPGAGTISDKFSSLFAEARDAGDETVPGALDGSASQGAKKSSAKGEKNDKSNLRPGTSQPEATSKADSPVILAAPASRVALPSTALLFGPLASQHEAQGEDSGAAESFISAKANSDSPRVFPPRFGIMEHGVATHAAPPGAPAPVETQNAESSNPADLQPIPSATHLLNTWSARGGDTNLQPVMTPGAGVEPSGEPNGKPENAAPKSVSEDALHHTASTLGHNDQSAFTFLQSPAVPAVAPAVAPKPAARPELGSATKREPLQGNAIGGAMGKQEKAVPRVASGSKSEGFDAADQGSSHGKEAFALGSVRDADQLISMVSPGSVVAMHASPVAVEGQAASAVASSKESSTQPQSQAAAVTQEVDASAEVTLTSSNASLHAAKLVSGLEKSELRMGLRAGEFGNVDIRTSLARNHFTAEISVERGELSRALAAELPSLQYRLTEQHLPAANITVQDHPGGALSQFQQESRQGKRAIPTTVNPGGELDGTALPVLPVEAADPAARLDIHM